MKYISKKITTILFAITLLCGCLSGCTVNNLQEGINSTTKIATLVIGSSMDIKSISRSDYYYNVLSGTLTHMALTRLDDNNVVQPMMAEFSTKDSKTWVYKIKEGLTWHDGEKVTADDVKFTVEYISKVDESGMADKFEQINIIDEKTIELVYKESNARANSDLTTFRILPKHIFETVEDYGGFNSEDAAIGCGPYKFVRFDANAGVIEYSAYEDFVDGKPNVSNIMVKLFKNTDTMYMALKSEEIDMVYFYAGGVDSSVTKDLKESGNLTLMPIEDVSNPVVLVFNNEKEPVSSIAVRTAIAQAIDYEKCRELFGSEYSTPSNYGFIPTGTVGYVDTNELVRNLDGAKSTLKHAGAVDSDGDAVLEMDGKKLELEILIRSDKAIYARVGELLQANLKDAGISVTFKNVDVPTFRAMSETEHSNIGMITRFTPFGMGMGAGMATSYLDGRLTSNAQGQVMDNGFADIVDELKSAITAEEYNEAAKKCQEYYAKNTPAIALYWDSYIQAYNSKLDSFSIDGTFGIVNQQTWFSITAK